MKAACFLRGESAAFLIHVSVEIDFRVMQNEPSRHEKLKIDSMAHEKFWDLLLKIVRKYCFYSFRNYLAISQQLFCNAINNSRVIQ